MSTDPIQHLRDQLVEAAARLPSTRATEAPRRIWRPRRPVMTALAALVIAAPATAAVAGVDPFGSGSTPDGSIYTTERFVAQPNSTQVGPTQGAACRRTDFRDRSGALTSRSTACRDAHSKPTDQRPLLEVGYVVAPGNSLLIQGTVSAQATRVTIAGVSNPVRLVSDDDGRKEFSAATADSKPLVIAFDGGGRELARYEVPLQLTPGK